METRSEGLGEFFIRMIDSHAEANDNEFVGQIILFSLGIDALCTMFCKCRNGGYNLAWSLCNGDEYIHTFSREEIERALIRIYFEYSIKVTRSEK